MKKEWQILAPDAQLVENLCKDIKCHPAIASILVNRHIFSAEHVSNFLNTTLNHLSPPFSITDMDSAVDRIVSAVLRKEKILIFGDYDVDGVTAAALLTVFLQEIGARTKTVIPHRKIHGYGLNSELLDQLAEEQGETVKGAIQCDGSVTIIRGSNKIPL